MERIKEIFSLLINLISKPFYFFANLASIIGLIIILATDSNKVLYTFIFFNILLLVFTGVLIYTVLELLNRSSSDFDSKSTFIKYETIDGITINYEVYKLIQCKRPILSQYPYGFKWTGTKPPVITSNLQAVVQIINDEDPSIYNRAILKFDSPLTYNSTCVLHFKATLDDTDKKSDTYVSSNIKNSVDVVHYRIILKNRENISNAILERKKIDSITPKFNALKEIAFDSISKSYEYHLLNPEIGYIYRIRWER